MVNSYTLSILLHGYIEVGTRKKYLEYQNDIVLQANYTDLCNQLMFDKTKCCEMKCSK